MMFKILERMKALKGEYTVKEIAYSGDCTYSTAWRCINNKQLPTMKFLINLESSGILNLEDIK